MHSEIRANVVNWNSMFTMIRMCTGFLLSLNTCRFANMMDSTVTGSLCFFHSGFVIASSSVKPALHDQTVGLFLMELVSTFKPFSNM